MTISTAFCFLFAVKSLRYEFAKNARCLKKIVDLTDRFAYAELLLLLKF